MFLEFNDQGPTVQLDVVDIPAGEGVSIDVHVADDARVSGAGEVSVVLVDAELHALAVDLKFKIRYSMCKTCTEYRLGHGIHCYLWVKP